jgi:Iron-containing redox enzyme
MDVLAPSAVFRLRTTFAQAEPALAAAAAQLWRLPGLGDRYPEYLRTMYGVIKASVPLMELAAAHCARRPADPITAPLRAYLVGHIEEERGHDEWLLEDLAVLGHPATVTASALPPPAVAQLVGTQYYWISHHHPVALLGYIAVMEANAPHPSLAARLVEEAAVPEAAVRTVRDHAALDAGHTDAVFELIDSLPLTQPQVTAVAVSGLCTALALMGLFTHIAYAR